MSKNIAIEISQCEEEIRLKKAELECLEKKHGTLLQSDEEAQNWHFECTKDLTETEFYFLHNHEAFASANKEAASMRQSSSIVTSISFLLLMGCLITSIMIEPDLQNVALTFTALTLTMTLIGAALFWENQKELKMLKSVQSAKDRLNQKDQSKALIRSVLDQKNKEKIIKIQPLVNKVPELISNDHA